MSENEGPGRPLSIDEGGRGSYPIEKLTGSRRMPAMQDQAGRVPPQATDVEKAVLGAALISEDALIRLIPILDSESFYDSRHQRIYQALVALNHRQHPVDLVTVTDELRRRGELEDVGGGYYLAELTASVATPGNAEHHGRIVAEKAILRGLITTLSTLIGTAFDPASDPFETLDLAEQEIFKLSESHLRRGAQSMKDVLVETIERLESIHGNEGGITGIPSGYHTLDQMTGGWQNSDLVIIAARPSMGKTAFSLGAARNAALDPNNPTPVAIFSLEMSASQLAQRLLMSEARIDAQAARTGRLQEEDWPRLVRAAGRLSTAPIFIDDTPALGILELRAKCRRLKAEQDIGLIIVDYLQLMTGAATNRSGNREQEIASISRSLKGLAKELNVPVLALAQLSRAVETRGGDKRPQLSDLRESGSIEQDADIVSFIYRAEQYWQIDDAGNPTEGLAEVIIGKQRNGPTGTAQLAFVKKYARFENLTTIYSEPNSGMAGDGAPFVPPPPDAEPPAPF